MKSVLILILSAAFVLSAAEPVKKTSPEVQAVYEMFEAQGMPEQMNHILMVMIQNQLKETPELAKCVVELTQFYMRCAGYEVLKEELAQIYLKHFTVAEIREITRFYRTPTGQKMRKVSANILLEANELSKKRLQAEVPKFLQELKEKGLLDL